MNYDFKAVPEASWYALGAAVGGVVGAVLAAVGVDAVIVGGIVAAITPLPRAIAGVFLPQPKS